MLASECAGKQGGLAMGVVGGSGDTLNKSLFQRRLESIPWILMGFTFVDNDFF
jgi:hypothetical protein